MLQYVEASLATAGRLTPGTAVSTICGLWGPCGDVDLVAYYYTIWALLPYYLGSFSLGKVVVVILFPV